MKIKSLFTRRASPTQVDNGLEAFVMQRAASSFGQNIRNIRLIFGREFKARTQTRGYLIATIALVVMIVLAAAVPGVIEFFSANSQTQLVVINNAGTIGGQSALPYLNQSLNNVTATSSTNAQTDSQTKQKPPFDIKEVAPAEFDRVHKQLESGEINLLLVINRETTGELNFEYYTKDSKGMGNLNRAQLQSAAFELNFIDRLTHLGVSPNQLSNLFQPPQTRTITLEQEQGGASQEETIASYFVAMAAIIMLFTGIMNYGVNVAQGSAEEKSNRVMEIMVNAVTPFQLMMGKIIGIGLAGLVQMGLMVVVGVGAFLAQDPIKKALLGDKISGTSFNITSLSLGMLGLVILYFLLGFLLFATLYAAVGSIASRQEEVQSGMTPLTFLFLAFYFTAIFALQTPDALWVKWLSFVPFLSPMLVPVRASLSTLDWWEIPLNVILMVLFIILFTWLAARIYRAGVLMYGQKPRFSKLVKLVFTI